MGASFHQKFHESYAVHEVIDQIVREGTALDVSEVERRVRGLNPSIEIPAAELVHAIAEAIANTPEAAQPASSDR